jgi:hypothetical protein
MYIYEYKNIEEEEEDEEVYLADIFVYLLHK